MTDESWTCSEPGCDRPRMAKGLCSGHHARRIAGSTKTGPLNETVLLTDEPHMACPPQLLQIAANAADLDARNIVRIIWPHLLEAHLAGLEPFTLVVKAS